MPNQDDILQLHRRLASDERALNIVYGHSKIVAELAKQIIAAKRLRVDEELVPVGAMLHDVGYYPLFDEIGFVPKAVGISHGVVGSEILRKEGLPEEVCLIAERHTGLGLTREYIHRSGLPLPARDLVPDTPEEWLLTYVDKLHTKSLYVEQQQDVLGWFNTPESYVLHARQFGEDNANRFNILIEQYGRPNLERLARKHGQELK